MPSNLPSSFASAAAGQNPSRDTRTGARSDGRGNASGEWARSGRSTNGGTLTFRRTSTTPSNQSLNQTQASEPIQSASADPAVISALPFCSTNVDSSGTLRYAKEELLAILNTAQDSNSQRPDISALFLPGWTPGHINGTTSRGWGKTGDPHVVPPEPDICWDAPGSTRAVGLREMTSEEKEVRGGTVESVSAERRGMKTNLELVVRIRREFYYEATGPDQGWESSRNGDEWSENLSLAWKHQQLWAGLAVRRVEARYKTTGGLASPTSTTRHSRDEVSSWFGRKILDPKDSTFEEPEEDMNARDATAKPLPFGGLMRNNTTPSGSGFSGASPWPASTSGALPGLGSFGHFALPGSTIGEKRPGNLRGESRLAHLIPKESSDNIAAKSNEGTAPDSSRPWRPRQRTDTDPFGEDSVSGSAVLGGAQDTSPPPMSHPPLHTSSYDTPVKGSTGDFGMASLNLGGHLEHDQTPLSPSETNPYRSPLGERGEHEDAGDRQQSSANASDHIAGYSGLPRSFTHAAFDGSDRSQTSSVGAKPYPPLSNLTSWPSSNTPDRERAAFSGFGGSLFGPVGDLQSPSLGNLGGVFGPASAAGFGGSGSFGRASKLGSLFPPAMQAQMQAQDNESLSDSVPDLRQPNPLGAIGRNAPGDHTRETDSPMRAGRGVFAELFAQAESTRTPASSEPLHSVISTAPHGQAFPATSNAPSYSNQASDPPSVQSRTMVMPDRMRWVYLDPQGHQQGPFTGLEMNDWYKANFFTPDLRVKKLEDSEFEPLGQLIRRIGNSREPFLVPQIGIPHGPPSQTGPFSANASGVIQPPLVGAFPSFGRTLTAEEQNNLERRKQEEQYIMARHREFYATQQSMGRVPIPGVPGLHHHSSAHSLQSQPSFGSIASPTIAIPPQPPIGAIGTTSSFFDTPATHQVAVQGSSGQNLDMFREDELVRLSGPERQMLAGLHNTGALGGNLPPQQPVGAPASEAGVRSQLPGSSELVEDAEGFRGRLQEFEQLRAQHEAEMMDRQATPVRDTAKEQVPTKSSPPTLSTESESPPIESPSAETARHHVEGDQSASLTKQYQQAQAAAAAAKISGLPLPFPPPPSATPLPAPAPQRVKSNLPEQYATSSRSGTPDIMPSSAATHPPPLAPWAKDGGIESHKGPSLKEIQQAEALKAAKADEAAALARRALLEQEAAREREKAAAVAPGLPTTSTWGTASPVNPGTTTSPWTKPAPGKTPISGNTSQAQITDKKKTLADIQREEEARKLKAKEVASQTGAAASAGKRYADLASKPNALPVPNQVPSANTSGWATVGAGGKVKAPTGPSSVQGRSTSSSNAKQASTATAPPSRPAVKPASSTIGPTHTEAIEEFTKWLHGQLAKGITGVTDNGVLTAMRTVEAFANTLIGFPLAGDLISDAIYANSKTMDGRHFAEEFIRRKKLADRGIVEKQPTKSPSGDAQSSTAGGWNEVAKKSSHKESSNDANAIQGAGFKVVPGRKKGKK
ncbi:kinesin-like protein [Parahypoxylon ruwenzoriense]